MFFFNIVIENNRSITNIKKANNGIFQKNGYTGK